MAQFEARKKRPERKNARQTRNKLLEAGRKVFAAKGLGGARLREDILAAAGVSTGSFYHQFANKAELLVEILRRDGDRAVHDVAEDWQSIGRVGPIEASERTLRHLFKLAEENPDFVKIYVREYYSDNPSVRSEIRRYNQRTLANLQYFYELIRKASGLPIDTELIATLFGTLLISLLNYYLGLPRSQRPALRERYIAGLVQLGAGGILAIRCPEDAT